MRFVVTQCGHLQAHSRVFLEWMARAFRTLPHCIDRTMIDAQWTEPLCRVDDPEAVLYALRTSGPTGKPRGVEVTQGGAARSRSSHARWPLACPARRVLGRFGATVTRVQGFGRRVAFPRDLAARLLQRAGVSGHVRTDRNHHPVDVSPRHCGIRRGSD